MRSWLAKPFYGYKGGNRNMKRIVSASKFGLIAMFSFVFVLGLANQAKACWQISGVHLVRGDPFIYLYNGCGFPIVCTQATGNVDVSVNWNGQTAHATFFNVLLWAGNIRIEPNGTVRQGVFNPGGILTLSPQFQSGTPTCWPTR
jgi:hypothetical protein